MTAPPGRGLRPALPLVPDRTPRRVERSGVDHHPGPWERRTPVRRDTASNRGVACCGWPGRTGVRRSHLHGQVGISGALSIGIGGMVGGGFFATFGLAVVGARGATWIAFLLGGLIALITAYSYVRLTLRYPGPGGTVSFVRHGFGIGLWPASINVLLILSYVAIMAVYARALAAYSVQYLPAAQRDLWTYVIASASIIIIGLVNFAGTRLMQRSEAVFNTLKLCATMLVRAERGNQLEPGSFPLSPCWPPGSGSDI